MNYQAEPGPEGPQDGFVPTPEESAQPQAAASTPTEATNEPTEVDEPSVENPPENPLEGAPEALLPALKRRGFESLTAVQKAVAAAEEAHRDLRISSQTGSGKTVAIGFALLDGLVSIDRRGPTTLVIAPTRELAMQVKEELSWLFAGQRDVHCEVVTGGTNIERERVRLRRRPAVLVGTPGRLLDHLRRGALDLTSTTQLVLDEADQMLDLGFKDELDAILDHLPEQRRTHLVSATFPPAVLELASRFQQDPLEIAGTDIGEAHEDIEHIACRINSREHYQAVVNLLLMAGDDRTLIFVRTREETARMADKLASDGISALPLNGDLAQAQRTRTLNAFRNGTIRTLVATDVAARGIDVPSVTMVIHVELPIDAATYVHRSGRTGRAGQKGRSVLLVPKPRAGRSKRLYHTLGIDARWASPPSAQQVNDRLLKRAEEQALEMLKAAPAATPAKRAAAANLLQERDPIEVVALLLGKSMAKGRKPFDLAPPRSPAPSTPDRSFRDGPRGNSFDRPQGPAAAASQSRNNTLGARRGTPGSVPSWQRPEQPDRDNSRPEIGFTRFRINWGMRDGADARRILAHVCRRGDIDSKLIGSIELSQTSSTFDVDNRVATPFGKRVQKRDRRDPHLFIKRDDFRGPQRDDFRGPQRGDYAGATRTRQSR